MYRQRVQKTFFRYTFLLGMVVALCGFFLPGESWAQVPGGACVVGENTGTCKTSCSAGEINGGITFECGTDGILSCCYTKNTCGDGKCTGDEQTTCPGDCTPAGEECSGTYPGSGNPAEGQCSSTAVCSGLTTYVGSCSEGRVCCAPNEPGDGTGCPEDYTCKIDDPGTGWTCNPALCGGGTGNFCCKSSGGSGGPGPGHGSGGWDIENFAIYGLPDATLWSIIEAFMLWILSLISLIAVIAFVISGMQYLLSAGNEKMIESAKRHMVWSIVGVIVSLLGLIILYAADLLLRGSDYF